MLVLLLVLGSPPGSPNRKWSSPTIARPAVAQVHAARLDRTSPNTCQPLHGKENGHVKKNGRLCLMPRIPCHGSMPRASNIQKEEYKDKTILTRSMPGTPSVRNYPAFCV
jgi:hypothetical protein